MNSKTLVSHIENNELKNKRKNNVKESFTWNEFINITHHLISNINYGGKEYKYIYPVPRGGLIPGVILSYNYNLPLLLTEQDMLSKPLIDILIVDDIVDSGNTLLKYFERGYDIASVFVRHTTIFTPKYYGHQINHSNWIMLPYDNPDIEDTISKVKEKNGGEGGPGGIIYKNK